MTTRNAIAAMLVLLVTASLALANPYDKWAAGGCERALQTKSLIGTTPDGKHVGWRKPMTTQRVANYVSTYVGQENGKVVAHNDATVDLLRQQLIAAGRLPKDLPNRMDSDSGETGNVDMKSPTDPTALGSTGTGGPGATAPPPATGAPAPSPGAPAPPASTAKPAPAPAATTPTAAGAPAPAAATPAATTPPATSSMAGGLDGLFGLWNKAIDSPIPTCVILLMLGFAGHMWQKRRT